jgi:hypothetical protein
VDVRQLLGQRGTRQTLLVGEASITRAAIATAIAANRFPDAKAIAAISFRHAGTANDLGQYEKVSGSINRLYWYRLFAKATYPRRAPLHLAWDGKEPSERP